MVATTVTPLMVRVVFRRKIGRSRFSSGGFRRLIKSAFEGTVSSWYLPAVLIFNRFMSSHVGFGVSINVCIISRSAKVFSGNLKIPEYGLTLQIDKLN